jgi:xanthine dehydrogenase accessory factor
MKENEYLAKNVKEQLKEGLSLVLVSIVNIQGSTPRHDGTKMIVGADGKGYGTIGGSLIEAAAIVESQSVFSQKKSKIFSYELTGKDARAAGMICGGKAEILLDYIPPSAKNQEFAECWYNFTYQGKDFYLMTHLSGSDNALDVLGHAIVNSEGRIASSTSLTTLDIDKVKPELHNITTTSILPLSNTRVMVDRIRKLKTLYCFGAGHVAVPTAHLAALVGFQVVIIDDRQEFANAARFPEAAKVCIVEDFNNAFEGLEIDEDSFIVIVTRGHAYDRAVLGRSLKTRAGYIGMIGSRGKKEAIYEALMDEGVSKEQLAQVHSPIGIDIGGETPEEIAVSIVAELIKVRSTQSR